MSEKKITDKEFIGWQPMQSLSNNPNYWIYFSPDNLEVALINTINNQVIFIMDRKTGVGLYKARNSEKHAKIFYAMRRMQPFQPRRVV